MIEDNFQDETKRAPSVARNDMQGDSAFSIKTSPFNPVKLELGIILLVAIFLLMIIHRFTSDSVLQVTILLLYGTGGMAWLILRIRRVAHQHNNQESD